MQAPLFGLTGVRRVGKRNHGQHQRTLVVRHRYHHHRCCYGYATREVPQAQAHPSGIDNVPKKAVVAPATGVPEPGPWIR